MARNFILRDELDRLPTESYNSQTSSLSKLSTTKILEKINAEDVKVPKKVGEEIPHIAKAVDCVVKSLRNHGKLFYVGAGTSGRLAVIDAAELLPTFGVGTETVRAIIAGGRKAMFRPVEGSEDEEAQGRIDLQKSGLSKVDAVIGISASGRTPFVSGALEYAKDLGAKTIALTSNPGSRITKIADIVICPKTGAEVIAGSTRMKGGTAQKLVLNMISTTTMVRLGKVHGNLMVNLKPVSAKLIERQMRMVMQATGLSRKSAKEILDKAKGNAKVAILMAKSGLSLSEAEKLLKESSDSLDIALNSGKENLIGHERK